jgi:hypothetical protein
MMCGKFLVKPSRLRRVPPRFSWVDQRLVRHGHLRGCGQEALALYLFLVIVGDANGLSWYSDLRLCLELGMDQTALDTARRKLEAAELIAYAPPFYQVLEVPDHPPSVRGSAPDTPRAASVVRPSGERPATPEERRAIIEEAFGKGVLR